MKYQYIYVRQAMNADSPQGTVGIDFWLDHGWEIVSFFGVPKIYQPEAAAIVTVLRHQRPEVALEPRT